MHFCDFLPAANIRLLRNRINSRKKVLETLAEMMADAHSGIDKQTIFNHLTDREKLGSTALGQGIAVPHCRIPNLDTPRAALLHVVPGVDYDAPDGMPVTMFFTLLVPENAAEEHLELLSGLAATLAQPTVKEQLLEADSAEQIMAALKR